MADLTTDEIREGRWMLGGPRIVFWIALVLMILGTISAIISFFTGFFGLLTESGSILTFLSSIGSLCFAILWVVLYWVELAGMSKDNLDDDIYLSHWHYHRSYYLEEI